MACVPVHVHVRVDIQGGPALAARAALPQSWEIHMRGAHTAAMKMLLHWPCAGVGIKVVT